MKKTRSAPVRAIFLLFSLTTEAAAALLDRLLGNASRGPQAVGGHGEKSLRACVVSDYSCRCVRVGCSVGSRNEKSRQPGTEK